MYKNVSSVCQLSSCFFHFFRFLAMLRTSLVNQLITSQCFREHTGKPMVKTLFFFHFFPHIFPLSMGGAGKAIASVRRENGLSEHFQMPMPCTVDAIQKVANDGISEVKVKKWGDLWRCQLITHSKKTINSWDIIWDICV